MKNAQVREVARRVQSWRDATEEATLYGGGQGRPASSVARDARITAIVAIVAVAQLLVVLIFA